MESSTAMIRIVVLSVLPGLVLIVQNGVRLKTSSEILRDTIARKKNVVFTLEVDNVIHQTEIERGLTSLYVTAGSLQSLDDMVFQAYQRTDDALEELSRWIYTAGSNQYKTKHEYQHQLNKVRNQSNDLDLEEVVDNYSSFIANFIDWMVGIFEHKTSDLWAEIVAYHMLINGKECVAIERSLGTSYFTTGSLSTETLLWYKGRHELALSFLRQFGIYSNVAEDFRSLYVDQKIEDTVNTMRMQVLSNSTHVYSVQTGLEWVNNMTEYINELDQVIRAMANYLSKKTEEEMEEYEIELVADIIIVLLTVVIVPLLAFFVYKIAKKLEEIRKSLQEKTVNLEREQERTETLLSQLIPAKIAKRMHRNSISPEYYECITVMFSDLCDFSVFVNKSTPDELIGLVNDIFDVIEKRVAVHNVSKIGCLGNVLMVGSGLHQRHTDRHALHVASLALDMMDRVQHITATHIYGEKIKLRIGISTGPVVSGVVEGTFPRFCMYGKATADAERMMTTSLPQRIQITESTFGDLDRHKEFVMQERDDLNRQSLGYPEKKAYWLIGSTNRAVQLDAGLLQAIDV